ncbi:hypothetical protein BYT27DRAFT_7342857 [Phlegmacium glaucopus]|nr:hypothetical protein BYT27DRAFT_7342857 [Phlegmacium glaucopus]
MDVDPGDSSTTALSVLSKQQPVPGTEPSVPTTSEAKETRSFTLPFYSGFPENTEQDILQRSRNLIVDSVIDEITREDPQGHTEYQQSIRHHVVAFCQRIRVSLLVVDHLMALYNTSVTDSSKNLS